MGMRPPFAMASLAALLILLPPADGFAILPPGSSPHDQITAEAATPLGFTGPGLEALQQAVRRPDLDESKVKLSGDKLIVIDATASYAPSHHCDRLPPSSAAEAFAGAADYVAGQREQARQFAVAGHPEMAVRALGNALHALQDCHSHSDIVDHDAATREAFAAALLGQKPLPQGIRICAFQPGLEVAEMPPGDAYPHGLYNKDNANSTADAMAMLPEGRTKYFAARAMAVAATSTFLTAFMGNLTPAQRTAILGVASASAGQGAHLLPLPGIDPLAVLAAATVGFVLGGIWLSPPVFGKRWLRLLGHPETDAARWHWKNLLLALGLTLLAACVLAWFVKFAAATDWLGGAEVGLLAWLGFVALLALPRATMERSWMPYVIDTAQKLLVLVPMGALLAMLG